MDEPFVQPAAQSASDERRAVALGYHTFVFKLIATMLSATIAALAGMMLVLYEKSATYELLSINLTTRRC